MKKKTFTVQTLGCFRNTYDSQMLEAALRAKGYAPSEGARSCACDTLIVNTCGFIDAAKEESLEAIRAAVALKKKKRVKRIVIGGCLVKRYRLQLARHFPQVDEWFGLVPNVSAQQQPRWGYSAFLKICDGCRNQCSYCAIPLIKGGLRSRPQEEILEEVRALEAAGTKEINIIGQDITSWGKDLKGRQDLTALLARILRAAPSVRWFRLIYAHPAHIPEPLIELIRHEKRICKYIDLPIQHINDRILKAMNRPTSGRDIRTLIARIRTMIPECTIRTSVIAGFPGESEREFGELLTFIRTERFERLGAFAYSREEGTPAFSLTKQVHPATKKRRVRQIMEAQASISADHLKKYVGKALTVLVEKKEDTVYVGRSEFDAPEVDGLVFIHRRGLACGEFARVTVTDSYEHDLVAV